MTTKHEIAEVLDEIGTLLELQGENPFKVRAYKTGARAIEAIEQQELSRLIAEERLGEVAGIGEALSKKILELAGTGRLEFYEKLKSSIEPGLVEMLQIPGLGPKKIKALHDSLGIKDIAGLAAACEAGQIAPLAGFGEKTQQKILVGIKNRAAWGQRHLWWDAWELADPIVAGLRALPQVTRAEAAGSLRRGAETVGDLDFLVSSSEPGPVMDWFAVLPGVAAVTARGDTKVSVRFESGLQADLRIVPDAQFVFALHHFTGSKDHNVKMRGRALERGLTLGEWGLVPVEAVVAPGSAGPGPAEAATGRKPKGGAKSAALGGASPTGLKDEAELFSLLGLNFIPPELREGIDEIEAAERGPLPRLVELKDLRGAFHNHTTSSDGRDTLAEMAAAAQALGWEYLGIADHSKSSVQAKGMNEERLLAQVAEIKALNDARRFSTRVFAGVECDILPDGRMDFGDDVLAQLDYVVASVHSVFGQEEPVMTARLIRAIENPHTTMLGHMTGRLLLEREGYRVDVAKVVDAAIANGVAIELNASPHRLDLDWRHWRRAAERGAICVINPDAHRTGGLEHVRAGINSARKGWLSREQVLNARPLAGIIKWLEDRK